MCRAARFGENLFVVLLMMLHPTQELEPHANPARFRCQQTSSGALARIVIFTSDLRKSA